MEHSRTGGAWLFCCHDGEGESGDIASERQDTLRQDPLSPFAESLEPPATTEASLPKIM